MCVCGGGGGGGGGGGRGGVFVADISQVHVCNVTTIKWAIMMVFLQYTTTPMEAKE